MLTAIKEITHIKNHQLTMHIPDDFKYEKVEVLIIPFETPIQDIPNTDDKALMDKVFKDARRTIISQDINVDGIMMDMNNALS
jgi:hypothetical protein